MRSVLGPHMHFQRPARNSHVPLHQRQELRGLAEFRKVGGWGAMIVQAGRKPRKHDSQNDVSQN